MKAEPANCLDRIAPSIRDQLGSYLRVIELGRYSRRIYERVFNDDERQRYAALHANGVNVADIFAESHGISPYRALIELSRMLFGFPELDYRRLVEGIGETVAEDVPMAHAANALRDPKPSAVADAKKEKPKDRRRMQNAELLGSHVHKTASGHKLYIVQRDGKYVVRGRYQGQVIGLTLGADAGEAAVALRRTMGEIEDGTFVRPSERRSRPLKSGLPPRMDIRALCDAFLAEKLKTRGKQTADDYRDRLEPVIAFAEQATSRRKWPLAADCDRNFAVELRKHLYTLKVTANGHPASDEKRISPRHVFNILDCVRSMIHWARRPEVNQLPSAFINPMTKDIVGSKPSKDPLQPVKWPPSGRMALVRAADAWQLSQLLLSIILPLRPEHCAGLLISEVNFDECLLRFGTRLGGRDFDKGRVTFITPFPRRVAPLLRYLVAGRGDGPLLRRRRVVEGKERPNIVVHSTDDVTRCCEQAITSAKPAEIQTPQDQKGLIRRTLRQMGGVSEQGLGREFKRLVVQSGLSSDARFYDLRGSISTELNRAGVSHLVQRYVTGHTTNDIMNDYVALDPVDELQSYFDSISPLLDEIAQRADGLGIPCDELHEEGTHRHAVRAASGRSRHPLRRTDDDQ